jgi:2',3'-cyclic-nucleotide 2'-phosphodiesterase (5'-nucleotidase family)
MVSVDESIEPDPTYQPIADRWRNRLLTMMPFLPARLAEAAVPLDGRETAVRNADSNWATFVADQMRTAFPDLPADLALVNGGTIRIDDYIAEDITWEDIARTFGFPSQLRYLEMTGDDFREAMEAGYRGVGPSKGYFPQISGFRVCVDRSRPDGERIVQLQVPADGGWAEIDKDTVYAVVAPDFLVRGGDGYDFSEALQVSPAGSELKYLVLDAVMKIQAAGGKVGSATDPDSLRFNSLPAGRDRCFE